MVVTDFATAELVKVAANSFLATKISFINAMAEVCEATGADVTQLATAIGHDARIGKRFLHPGLGFGGGCLPKDIRAFIARAGELGVDQAVSFLREVDEINLRRRARTDGVRPGAGRRRLPRHPGGGTRRGVQAELRRHARLAGPGRRRGDRPPRRRGRRLRPQGDGQRPRSHPELHYAVLRQRWRRGPHGCSPNGTSSEPWTRPRSASSSRSATSSTAATCSTRRRRAAAGTTALSAVPG